MQKRGRKEIDVLTTPGHLISLAARAFARLSEARLKPLGLGVGCVPVLVALRNGIAMTQRDLARFARMEQPSMAQMLGRMERDGLIRTSSDPQDGRIRLVALTSLGESCLPDACVVLFQGNHEALKGFTAAEVTQLGLLITRLTANLDRMETAAALAR